MHITLKNFDRFAKNSATCSCLGVGSVIKIKLSFFTENFKFFNIFLIDPYTTGYTLTGSLNFFLINL